MSVVHEVAREYAERRVAELRSDPINLFGTQVRLLDVQDSEDFAARVFAGAVASGRIDRAAAVEKARAGDPLFQHALGLLRLSERPRKLQTNPKRETNYFRDIAITMLVQEILEGFEISPTTSKANRDDSGCGIVATAMGMTYDAVCKVWGRLGKQI